MTKQYPLILLNGFLYMVDEQADIDLTNYVVDTKDDIILQINNSYGLQLYNERGRKYWLKILASNDPALSILPSLPEIETELTSEECKEIANKYLSKAFGDSIQGGECAAMRAGYKAASKQRMYSEGDIENAYKIGFSKGWKHLSIGEQLKEFHKLLKSLTKQPKFIDVELTCGVDRSTSNICDCSERDMDCQFLVPKVDSNNKIIGRYIYEEVNTGV